jgi:3-(3-hydroxy-phenyl)propionate hydroxylase
MSEDVKPVLIAGAGPTGMMAAIELSRLNIPVRLIEKKAKPETGSRVISSSLPTLLTLSTLRLAFPISNSIA